MDGAPRVSVPAHLQPFYRSDPNPVEGVLRPVALRKGFAVLVSEGPIKTAYLSHGFDIYHPGDKKLILSPQEAS